MDPYLEFQGWLGAWAQVVAHGWEGLGKDEASPYMPGARTRRWVKGSAAFAPGGRARARSTGGCKGSWSAAHGTDTEGHVLVLVADVAVEE